MFVLNARSRLFTILVGLALSTAVTNAHGQWSQPELRAELLEMRRVDQDARLKCLGSAEEQMNCFREIAEKIDAPHTKRLNEIFDKHGFPVAAMVGKDGVDAFMLLVQHAVSDEIRERIKEPMRLAFLRKEIPPDRYAAFIDRLLVNQGKPQIYGSNFEMRDGRMVMSPVEDPPELNNRRRAAGLPPIEEYAEMLRELYKIEVVLPGKEN